MVNVPTSIGFLAVTWSGFEIILELISQKILKIDNEKNSIIFCTLNYKAKKEITVALLSDSNLELRDLMINFIYNIEQSASRNHIFHSMYFSSETGDTYNFLKRGLGRSGYTSKYKKYSESDLSNTIQAVSADVYNLQKLAGLSEEDLHTYAESMRPKSTSV